MSNCMCKCLYVCLCVSVYVRVSVSVCVCVCLSHRLNQLHKSKQLLYRKGRTIRKVMGRVGLKQKKNSGKRKSREKIFEQLLAT